MNDKGKKTTMKSPQILLACLISLSLSYTIHSQNQDTPVTATKVTDHIYMLEGRGGNIAVSVGEDGVFMVDDQYAHMSAKILNAVKEITNLPIKFLVNTHWHGDHTGGNVNMQKEGVVIVAHENVRKRMSTKQFNELWNRTTPPSPQEALPVVTFTQDITFHMNDEDIFVFHVHNAHTDGDAMVYFSGSNVLHMGDTYFNGKYPYIDISAGGSIQGYLEAHKKALLLIDDETKIIPGHLKLSTKAELQGYTNKLAQLKEVVEAEIKMGKTEQDIIANSSLTKFLDDENFGDWFIKPEIMRKIVYLSLTKSQNTN